MSLLTSRQLIIICGQSNARGAGLVTDVIDPVQAGLLLAYPNVPFVYKCDGNTDPPVYNTYANAPLGPRVFVGVNRFGIELTMMRVLDQYFPNKWACGKCAYDSTSLNSDWAPGRGAYSDLSPAPFTTLLNFIAQTLIDTSSELGAVIWIQGENDAGALGTANAYGTNLLAFIDALRAVQPGVPFIYGRLNWAYTVGGFTANLRASQEAIRGSRSNLVLVNTDDFPLQGDNTHYPAQSVIALGYRYAAAVLQGYGLGISGEALSDYQLFNKTGVFR